MKILKFLLAIVLLLIVFFVGKGLLTPSIYYESEVVVNKPAKEAWAVMSDEVNLPKWIKGFKRTKHISGVENTVGAISHIYVDEGGQEMMMKETITDVKPYELMAMKFTMDFMNMDYEMHFNETNGKTTIKTKSTTKGNGIFSKSIISFMPSSMKAQEDENLGKLKKLIEENTKNYFPIVVQDTLMKDIG